MLREPNSYYENRRSKSLLKVKTFHDDEATVLGYKEGTGRCQGMVGALRVRNTHGIEF
jgi:DNA ligase-1